MPLTTATAYSKRVKVNKISIEWNHCVCFLSLIHYSSPLSPYINVVSDLLGSFYTKLRWTYLLLLEGKVSRDFRPLFFAQNTLLYLGPLWTLNRVKHLWEFFRFSRNNIEDIKQICKKITKLTLFWIVIKQLVIQI